jgi:putative endonuclease
MNIFYVYVLRNQQGILYKGFTSDLEKRILEHNSGKNIYTRFNKPWDLVYKEEFTTKSDAIKRELFLKSGKGRDYLKNIIG